MEGEFDDDSDEERIVLSSRAVHTALLSSIPFSSAAIGMVVRASTPHMRFPQKKSRPIAGFVRADM